MSEIWTCKSQYKVHRKIVLKCDLTFYNNSIRKKNERLITLKAGTELLDAKTVLSPFKWNAKDQKGILYTDIPDHLVEVMYDIEEEKN